MGGQKKRPRFQKPKKWGISTKKKGRKMGRIKIGEDKKTRPFFKNGDDKIKKWANALKRKNTDCCFSKKMKDGGKWAQGSLQYNFPRSRLKYNPIFEQNRHFLSKKSQKLTRKYIIKNTQKLLQKHTNAICPKSQKLPQKFFIISIKKPSKIGSKIQYNIAQQSLNYLKN